LNRRLLVRPPRSDRDSPSSLFSFVAQFIEDVESYMQGKEAEATLNELQSLYQQYKQIEQGLQQNRIRLGNKLPEIKRALDTVKMLCEKAGSGEELDMNFELTDSVYAKAKVKDAESVYLWLGANVMLEYPLDEARGLLETNYANCKKNLDTNRSDLAFVKDNVTITEVSIARVYNWDVKTRKEAAEAEKKG
jgi:prefoldin subunit 5